jgi:hypothetical protein
MIIIHWWCLIVWVSIGQITLEWISPRSHIEVIISTVRAGTDSEPFLPLSKPNNTVPIGSNHASGSLWLYMIADGLLPESDDRDDDTWYRYLSCPQSAEWHRISQYSQSVSVYCIPPKLLMSMWESGFSEWIDCGSMVLGREVLNQAFRLLYPNCTQLLHHSTSTRCYWDGYLNQKEAHRGHVGKHCILASYMVSGSRVRF